MEIHCLYEPKSQETVQWRIAKVTAVVNQIWKMLQEKNLWLKFDEIHVIWWNYHKTPNELQHAS